MDLPNRSCPSGSSRRRLFAFLLTAISLLMSGETDAQIAVVVNTENPVESLTKAELRHIYLAEVTRWDFTKDRKEDVILIDYKGEVKTAEKFYEITAALSPTKVRMKWLGRILNGELYTLPISMESERKMLQFIAQNVGAVGFIRVAYLDPLVKSVKTIRIEGKEIEHNDYPLR